VGRPFAVALILLDEPGPVPAATAAARWSLAAMAAVAGEQQPLRAWCEEDWRTTPGGSPRHRNPEEFLVASLSIRKVIEQVTSGAIRIPAFQRGFVWDAEHVAYLMDSIYKGYPFGAVILWRTKEKLNSERDLGPFQLPDGQADFPVDYVLDGQQRITSIFGVFQSDLDAQGDDSWTHIYFDMEAASDLQESQFLALTPAELDPDRHFPINTFFDVTAYRHATRPFRCTSRTDRLRSVDL